MKKVKLYVLTLCVAVFTLQVQGSYSEEDFEDSSVSPILNNGNENLFGPEFLEPENLLIALPVVTDINIYIKNNKFFFKIPFVVMPDMRGKDLKRILYFDILNIALPKKSLFSSKRNKFKKIQQGLRDGNMKLRLLHLLDEINDDRLVLDEINDDRLVYLFFGDDIRSLDVHIEKTP